MSFPSRVSAVVLACRDVQGARGFFENLGWETGADPGAPFVPFALQGMVLVIQQRAAAVDEFGADAARFRDVGLLAGVPSADRVDAALAHAESAGARITAPARERPFGRGGSCVDPEGNVWEIAFSPDVDLAALAPRRGQQPGTVIPRLSTVTVATPDVLALRAFYERLGFHTAVEPGREDIAQFQLDGALFSTWIAAEAEAEVARPLAAHGLPYRHVELGIVVESAAAVDGNFEAARAAGATVISEPATRSWGGRSGYFADAEGFPWEIVHIPGASFTARGGLIVPGGLTPE